VEVENEAACSVPFRVGYLSVLDDESVPRVLYNQPPADLLARARAAGRLRFAVTFDVDGMGHPGRQAEAEFTAYQRACQAEAPAQVDPAHEQWQAERRRDADLQRLTGQLYEARASAQEARDEAAQLLAKGDKEAAADREQAAAGLAARERTLEQLIERANRPARPRGESAYRLKQQAADRDFSAGNDQRLAELYRMLAAVVYVAEDGQPVPIGRLLHEAAWRGALSGLLQGRKGVKKS
jgi:hypothetical protein